MGLRTHLLLCAVVALTHLVTAGPVTAPPMSASAFLSSAHLTDNKIQAARIKIYEDFIQNLALNEAAGAEYGQIVDLPRPPFTNMTLQLVIIKLSTLVANGFLFHEFFLPPGVNVTTKEKVVVLLYNQIPAFTAPFRPPKGYAYEPYFTGLDVLPYVPDPEGDTQPVTVSSSPSAPITITFPWKTKPANSIQCSTFNIRAEPIALNQSKDSSSSQVTCQSLTTGEFSLLVGTVPFAPPPKPPNPPESPPPPPQPVEPPVPLLPPEEEDNGSGQLTLGLTLGLAIPIVLLALLAAWLTYQICQRTRFEKMEVAAERAANLETALIAGQRAPSAPAVRTRAVALESEV